MERADMFFAGPDGPSRAVVAGLISDVGLPGVGGRQKEAAAADGLLALWFTLAGTRGMGRHLALKLLSDRRG